ncbi:MAG: RagB/SusD family nutrient uptake outer membrane protein [Bacteroidales bacterium]|nr:RagB/SusD family nutrient uptake outer membrane protein [Bacteroidales bacterium]
MKAKLYILIAAIALLTASCNFLDENLKGGYSSENYYTSASKAEMAVNAIYNSLYGNTLWMFGDVASDDSVKGGADGDQPQINEIDALTATADNGSLGVFWQDSYETIARANNAIANIAPMNIDEKLKVRLLGEAKFFRAYTYFNLVNIFGKVPLKTKPQNTSASIHVGLSSVADIYGQIDTDLTEAIEGLNDLKDGHVNRAAAYALLAKSKVFQSKWDDAVQAIQGFKDLNAGYGLEHNYADLFKSGGEDSVESIFAIRYATNKIASQGNLLNVWFSPFIEGGYHFNAPTQSFVDCFSEKTVGGDDDPRLDASIGRAGKPWFNGTTFEASWGNVTGYLVKKYDEDAVEDMAKSQSTIPQHRIRYAEVLLLEAEALNEASPANVGAAAAALDQVRDRAGLAHTTASTQSAMRDAIRLERRRELGFEFHRFFDVMRYGRAYAVAALGSAAWPSDRYYFPIPQGETDANAALK